MANASDVTRVLVFLALIPVIKTRIVITAWSGVMNGQVHATTAAVSTRIAFSIIVTTSASVVLASTTLAPAIHARETIIVQEQPKDIITEHARTVTAIPIVSTRAVRFGLGLVAVTAPANL